MRALKFVILLFVLSLLVLPAGAEAQSFQEKITIFVRANINVSVSVDCGDGTDVLDVPVGKTGACYITINNTGNLDDVLRIEAPLASGSEDSKGWLDYHFECPGTVGECSLNYSYADSTNYNPQVRNIQLDSDLKSTTFHMYATPYKKETSKIKIVGYSLSNRTMESLRNITVNTQSENANYGPFVVSGLNTVSVLILFILSIPLFYVAKFR